MLHASSRKEMESIVRNHMSKIAMLNLLQHRSGSESSKDEQDDLFEQELKQHMKRMKQPPTPYKAESAQNSSANSTVGQDPESSDGLGGMHQEMDEDDPSGEAPGFKEQSAFKPASTLWPTEAYTRGDSLRYL